MELYKNITKYRLGKYCTEFLPQQWQVWHLANLANLPHTKTWGRIWQISDKCPKDSPKSRSDQILKTENIVKIEIWYIPKYQQIHNINICTKRDRILHKRL